MNPTDGLPGGWEVVKEAPTAAEVIAHLDAHGVTGEDAGGYVQARSIYGAWRASLAYRSDFAWHASQDEPKPEPHFRLIAPIVRPQVEPGAYSADGSQGATGAGGTLPPGPIDHTDPLPPCPTYPLGGRVTRSRHVDPDECPNCGCLTTHRPGACEAAERDDPWEPTEGPGSGDDRYGPRPATETAA